MSDGVYELRMQARKEERAWLRKQHLEWHERDDSGPYVGCHTCELLDEPPDLDTVHGKLDSMDSK